MLKNLNHVSGQCLCGAIQYQVSGEVNAFHQCHCSRCRLSTGTAFAANIFTKPGNIRWLSGEFSIVRYELASAKYFIKAFCSHCGSPVPVVTRNGKSLMIPAGSLSSTIDISPDDNIFWNDRASWFDAGREVDCFAEYPNE
ncbi:MAG: GFA family protein [Gammaproteobacteria bacterium]|nr:GFA family protein [Gammaproteobacteria bacterium]